MDIGYIVGIIVAVSVIICGGIGIVLAKRNGKKSKWATWAILAGIVVRCLIF